MQTQTQSKTARRKPQNGHGAKTPAAAGTKTDWIVAAVSETGTAKFGDLLKRAVREGVFTEAKNLGAALCGLTARKKLKKVERGVYAMPGAKVVYDAAKPVKKPPAVEKKAAPVKTKPRKAASKPGRQASLLGSVYARLDGKIAAAANDEKEAAAGIREIDAQMKKLKSERAALVAKRAAAQEDAKKLRGSRRKVAELEAGVADILKA